MPLIHSAMASSPILQLRTLSPRPRAHIASPIQAPAARTRNTAALPNRRQLLFLLTATTTLTVSQLPSKAENIGLFGLRKKLKKVEEEAEEIVKEGFESAEKGLEAAEKGVEAAGKGIESAEREVEAVVSFSGFAQAGVVAGAEVVGVLVATSVVNGILGPERSTS